MRTAQPGDRVQVHYVKRLQDGCTASSRGGAPIEVTVGVADPRLPGLGLALVGLAPGASTTVRVPPERAHGAACAARVRRLARARFPEGHPLPVGGWAPVLDLQGRRRWVRVLEVRGKTVVVDTNHRGAGQSLELEVELVGIGGAGAAPPPQQPPRQGQDPWRDDGGEG
jgi:FKBP-type peptidyl-prolyl cis-trans isomerase 2